MSITTKHRSVFAVKALDGESRTFEGLASTWELDAGYDVIHPGAFGVTLNEWRRKQRTIPLLDGHQYHSVRNVLGKMVEAAETDDGLWTRWQVIDGQAGDELLALLRGGYVDALSIGFRPVKWEMKDSTDAAPSLRHIYEVELKEVSVVLFPMADGARIDLETVKSAAADLSAAEKAELVALLSDPAIPAPEGLVADSLPDEGDPDTARFDALRLRAMTVTTD